MSAADGHGTIRAEQMLRAPERRALFCAFLCCAFLSLIVPFTTSAASADPTAPGTERYIWRNVAIGGGGFVTGIIFHPQEKDLMYARTDVGGAYRWDAGKDRWIPITDWIGREDINYAGIESLALDPSDANRVYLAAGTYSGGRAAMFRSSNRGQTWERTPVPLKMGGNETGRANGERLAVDPNQGGILFFGSRRDGLWKSSDRGAHWNKVNSFPVDDLENAGGNRIGSPNQPVGVVCVVFDPSSGKRGSPSTTIYAAVSTTGTNFYRSTDGGDTWQAVAGQPIGLRPNHVVFAPGGTLYLSYGREPGPNTMSDGAVWKLNSKENTWVNISPVTRRPNDQPFGFGAVAVDAQHPATIVATTFCHWHPRDRIFHSTNAGESWTELWRDDSRWDHSSAPYTATRVPHWMGDVEINPFNSDHVLFTTGYGIWSCGNATKSDSKQPAHWTFFNEGLEETVPLALISPPEGAHLLSGLGDIDGFRHDDLNVSPPQGTYAGPRLANTEDIAFAGRKPAVIVRVGTGKADTVRAALSDDGGRTWRTLGSEPPNSSAAGTVAICAEGRTIVWTPRRGSAWRSVDQGTNWTECAGLAPGARVVADGVNPMHFYALDSRAGKLFVSTNAAVSFNSDLMAYNGANSFLVSAPDREGEYWLGSRSGLYHFTDGGKRSTRLESVREAYALGFGKPMAGGKSPAIYLCGRIDQLQALFRSDDGGSTWVRINDEQHQFGWINRVVGDPRVAGRVYITTGGRGILYGEPDSAVAARSADAAAK